MKNCTYVLRTVLLLIVCITSSILSGYSQQIEKGINVSNGDYLGFLEYKPVNYATEGNVKHPLIIFLHGIGERGNGTTDLRYNARAGLSRVIKAGHNMTFTWNGKTETFLVLSPQCPLKYGMWPEIFINELIKYAKENLRIDTNRIYLTGLSMGGGGTLKYISTTPDAPKRVAAAATICAPCTFDKGEYVANAKLPLWAFHAADDDVALSSCTDRAINRINAANPQVKPLRTIWPTGGHQVWDRVYTDTNYRFQGVLSIYEWFLGQNKSLPVNKWPVAKATGTTEINAASGVATLSGASSTDADGKIVRYVWKKLSGPNAGKITNAFGPTSTTTITGLTTEGTYTYELAVVDDRAGFTRDTITLNVTKGGTPPPNISPVARAGSDITITLPVNTVNLNGMASSDDDGTIVSYEWTKVSGPAATISGPASSTTAIKNLVEGTYIFKLKVTDNKGATAEAQVTVKVNPAVPVPNVAPVAKAGSDITITLPVNTVNLNGMASSDSDGTIVSYEWTKVSGPAATISGPASSTTAIKNLIEGTYVFKLKVTDNRGATAEAQVTVKVNPAPPPPNVLPVAKAGDDITITLPVNKVKVDGSGSTDSDGTIVAYAWAKISGPSQFKIATAAAAKTDITNLAQGTYVFRLRVTDNRGGTHDDNITIKVNPAPPPPNVAPVAQAGANKTITLPTNTVTVNGASSTDADGTIVSYAWSYISGPSSYHITNPNDAATTITGLEAGNYSFRLLVKDNDGASDADTINIKVNEEAVTPPPPNVAPIAEIEGTEINVTLPVNEVMLYGNTSVDEDGTIVSYTWSKVSGPSSFAIINKNAAITSVENLVEGVYYFSLTVKDNDGAIGRDTIKVIVNASVNQQPVADAGVDIEIQLPDPGIRLDGLDSYDPDGEIVTYLWEQVSGDNEITISNANTTTPGIIGAKEGSYVFRLTVTDDNGLTASDEVTLTVLPASSNPVDTIPVVVNPTDSIPEENLKYEEKVNVYPNPASSSINVRMLSEKQGQARVSIYNMNGMLLYSANTQKSQAQFHQNINVGHLKTGIYYVEIFIDGHKKTTKFAKR